MSFTRRVRMPFMAAVFVVATLLAVAFAATAQTQTIVFVPPQTIDEGSGQIEVQEPGSTLACTDSPFTFFVLEPEGGTCQVEGQTGPPEGLVCDIPAAVVVAAAAGQPIIGTLEAFECRTPQGGGDSGSGGGGGNGGSGGGSGGGGSGGGGGGATPITQEGEQDSEAGEVDQTYDVS